MTKRTASAVPNRVLFELRSNAALSQQEVAERINHLAESEEGRLGAVTANTVSRWERGVIEPSPVYRRLLAQLFGVPIQQLGFADTRSRPGPSEPDESHDPVGADDPRVVASRNEWRQTRRALNVSRAQLVAVASQLYPEELRLGDTGLITRSEWLPEAPVDLTDIILRYDGNAEPPKVDGTESETSHVRPYATIARRFPRYTQAIRDLDRPRLFDNRMSWRLLDVGWTNDGGQMSFGPTSYFAGADVFEALAHETAYARLLDDGTIRPGQAVLRELPFRRLVGDPFDLSRRPLLSAISTLTIRNSESPSFLLHRRDPKHVAIAGGMLQVIPSGVFQPSSVLPTTKGADFDLWRNIMREYSEELLGYPEHDGDGQPVRYSSEPFASLESARADGRLRVWCLGVALDALTLTLFGEILTVAIFDPNFFDGLAGEFVELNDEGSVVSRLLPLDEHTVTSLIQRAR